VPPFPARRCFGCPRRVREIFGGSRSRQQLPENLKAAAIAPVEVDMAVQASPSSDPFPTKAMRETSDDSFIHEVGELWDPSAQGQGAPTLSQSVDGSNLMQRISGGVGPGLVETPSAQASPNAAPEVVPPTCHLSLDLFDVKDAPLRREQTWDGTPRQHIGKSYELRRSFSWPLWSGFWRARAREHGADASSGLIVVPPSESHVPQESITPHPIDGPVADRAARPEGAETGWVCAVYFSVDPKLGNRFGVLCSQASQEFPAPALRRETQEVPWWLTCTRRRREGGRPSVSRIDFWRDAAAGLLCEDCPADAVPEVFSANQRMRPRDLLAGVRIEAEMTSSLDSLLRIRISPSSSHASGVGRLVPGLLATSSPPIGG